jgi:hypothetical protein
MTKQIMGSFRPDGVSSAIFESLPRAIRVQLAHGFRKIAESAGDIIMAAALTDFICTEDPASSLTACSSIARVAEDPEPAAADSELANSDGPEYQDQAESKKANFDSDGAADGLDVALADPEPKSMDFDNDADADADGAVDGLDDQDQAGSKNTDFDSEADADREANGLDVALAHPEPQSIDVDSDEAADGLDVTQSDSNGDEDHATGDYEANVGVEKTRAAKSNKNMFKQPTEPKWGAAYLGLHSKSGITASITTRVLSLMAAAVFVAAIVVVASTKATQKLATLEEKSPILGPVPISDTSKAPPSILV